MHSGANIQQDVRVTPNVTVPHPHGGSESPPEQRATAAVMCSQPVSRHRSALWQLLELQLNRF